jgi:hypothetical protein
MGEAEGVEYSQELSRMEAGSIVKIEMNQSGC